jgi:Meiotically up-regulated gene 113
MGKQPAASTIGKSLTVEGIELAKIIAGAPHAPVVYFLRTSGMVKIGMSTRLLARVKSFSLSLADVALVVPGGEDMERAYHQRFARQRLREDGEWFRIAGELLTFLTKHCPPTQITVTSLPRSPLPPGQEIGLRQAVESGLIKVSLDAVRTARAHDKRFPIPVGRRGPEFIYSATELSAWERHRPRAQRTAGQ